MENTFNKVDLNIQVAGLSDELKVIYLSQIYKETKRPVLFVTSSMYRANKHFNAFQNHLKKVNLFTMDDFLTSEAIAISPELKLNRIETLKNLIEDNHQVVVTNLMGFLRYLPSKSTFESSIITLEKGLKLDRTTFLRQLSKLGYERASSVSKTGEISIRGFIIDIFPASSQNPVRIEFWDDEIDSIKEFDVDTQRTTKPLKNVKIIPVSETLVDDEIEHRDLPSFTSVCNISGYLQNFIIVFEDYLSVEKSYEFLQNEIFNYNTSLERPGNTKYMFDLDEINFNDVIYFNELNLEKIKLPFIKHEVGKVDKFKGNLDEINNLLKNYLDLNEEVYVFLSSNKKIDKFKKVINDEILSSKGLKIVNQNLTEGFIYNKRVYISESEIFNKNEIKNKYRSKFKMGTKISDLSKLEKGDFVIHQKHGIGRYEGLKTLNKMGILKDFLQISYKGTDKLYIPVEKMELISKYSSKDTSKPKIHKLGGTEWEKTKLRVRKKVENIASELIKLYSEREALEGFSFHKDDEEQMFFESEFPFEETKDQIIALKAIKKDMESKSPMDRLLCGDVGFGKTEVAFRAVFKAINSGKQVALLCPTTILSQQHFKNAIERFKSFPVNIEVLNRFVTPKNQKHIISRLKDGKVDLLIGTHRILSEDIVYKDLGLLVIDEEQRFGVKHKEKIKEYKTNVDVLTLSATPIPRTLQMSMTGIRSLSLIETPPTNRYPVQTYVLKENKQIIKDAVYKEISRGGQTFILHNKVENIALKRDEIQKLIPDAKVAFAHGKMTKKEIEDVMLKFYNKEYDVLVSTTIIETGIDIESANTLIVLEADHFGLSQLYQLRGRVGRSNKIAYCYLMYNASKNLSDIASKRLSVIKDFTELGSGFRIAARDLSLRGAGDILGKEQAGFIDTVGIEIFLQMIKEEVDKIKGLYVKPEEITEEKPLLDVKTAIEDEYVEDEEIKILIHKSINKINTKEKLEEVKEELEDKYGKIPESLIIYMHEELFEKNASKLGIKQVRQTKNSIEIAIPKTLSDRLNGEQLFFDISKISNMFRFGMKFNRLIITLDLVNSEKHFMYDLTSLTEAIEKNIK